MVKILYLCLYNQLSKKFGRTTIVTRKKVFCEMGKHFLVPKSLKMTVVKELECMRLVKVVGRDGIQILKNPKLTIA